jgi:hypothetical protein
VIYLSLDAFMALEGPQHRPGSDAAFDFVMSVADGSVHEIDAIANGFRRFSEPASV